MKIAQRELVQFVKDYFDEPSLGATDGTPIILNCHDPTDNPSFPEPIVCDPAADPQPVIIDNKADNNDSIVTDSLTGSAEVSHKDGDKEKGDINKANHVVISSVEHQTVTTDNEIVSSDSIETGSNQCSMDDLQLPDVVNEGTQIVANKTEEVESQSPKCVKVTYLAKRGRKLKLKKPILLPIDRVIKNVHEPSFLQTNQDQILLRTKMFNKFLSLQIDTGASISCISDSILRTIHPNYEKNLKTYNTKYGLSGVTGNHLKIKGVYKMPIEVPMIGLIYLKVTVVLNPHVRLLGMDFMMQTKMSLIYRNGKHHVAFEKSSINKMKKDGGIIYNDKEITLLGTKSKKVVINCGNMAPNDYEATLLSRPVGIVMPPSIVKVYRRNGETKGLFAIGNTEEDQVTIAPYSIQIRLTPIEHDEVNYVSYDKVSEDMLNEDIELQYCKNAPEGLKTYMTTNVHRSSNSNSNREFKINKVCFECIDEVSPDNIIKDIGKVHTQHIDQKQFECPNEELPEVEEEYFFDPDSNDNLRYGEIGFPIPPTQEEIDSEIDRICNAYPDNVKKLLKPVLQRNQRLLKNAYDLPVTEEPLHFELKSEITKQTKVYPCKNHLRDNFFSTLQYMVYYGILERASASSNFGAPVFCIERKTNSEMTSKSCRILCDLRSNNSCIANSVSASMMSCQDILRSLVADIKYLSLLDISNCFYSIPVSQEVLDSNFNTILTPWGSFICKRALSGCSIVPSFMNNYLMKRLYLDGDQNCQYLQGVQNFFDDVTIASKMGETLESHVLKLSCVIERITRAGFQLNLAKSFYCIDMENDSLEVLGFKISKNKISVTDKRKNDILRILKTPKTLKELQQICGVLNYIRPCLNLEELKALGALPTFAKKGKLLWTEEAEDHMIFLKESLQRLDLQILIPPQNSISILYTDASDHTLAAMLFYAPLSIFEKESDDIVTKPMDDKIRTHVDKFDIPIVPISEITQNLITFMETVYYTYNYSINPSSESFRKRLLSELILLSPVFAVKVGGHDEYKKIIRQYEEKNYDNPFLEHFIIYCMTRVMNRPIHLLMNFEREMKLPYYSEGLYEELSPIFVSVTTNGYQLHALTKPFQDQKVFSKVTLNQLTSNEIHNVFQKAYKQNQFKFGGCYARKIPEATRNSPIHVKELTALTVALSHFSEYLKMNACLAVMDNSIVVHNLKSYKNRESTKLYRLGLSIAGQYPLLKIALCPTAQQKADVLTRLWNNENVGTKLQDEPLEIVNLEDYLKTSEIVLEENHLVQHKINYVSPMTFDYGFGNLATYEKVALETFLHHKDKLTDDKYKEQNGLLFIDKKIFLPESLYAIHILKTHVHSGHRGIEAILQIIKDEFIIEKPTLLRSEAKMLIGACLLCIAAKATFNKRIEWQSHYGTTIGESISIDCCEFTKTKQKKGLFTIGCLLIVIDNVSKYTSIYYLSEQTASQIINALLTHFSVNPIPKYVLSDNASQFLGINFKNFLRLFNITHVKSSPEHSKSRGKVERRIGTFRDFSRTFNLSYPDLRPELAYLFCNKIINHTKIKDLPVSPNFLQSYQPNAYVYQRDFRSCILDDVQSKLVLGDPNDFEKQRVSAKELFEVAMQKKNELHQNRMKRLNKNRYPHNFKKFDIVAVKNFDRYQKHKPIFLYDPHIIIEVRKHLILCQSVISGTIRYRHVSHCKKVGTVKDLNIPKEILLKNKIYGSELVELMKEGYKKDGKVKRRAVTRNFKPLEDAQDIEDLINDADSDSESDRVVHFELD